MQLQLKIKIKTIQYLLYVSSKFFYAAPRAWWAWSRCSAPAAAAAATPPARAAAAATSTAAATSAAAAPRHVAAARAAARRLAAPAVVLYVGVAGQTRVFLGKKIDY